MRNVELVGLRPSAAQRRRARKEAAALSAAAKRAVKASHAHREEILAVAVTVDEAVTAKDHDLICERMVKLESLCDRHLGSSKKSSLGGHIGSIGVAVFVALLLRTSVVEAFVIPSGSMLPTIQVGDHIFVNKFIYGLRVPFTTFKFFEWRKPRRGEVIVFIHPDNSGKDLIKRVVAVEGDEVEVRRGVPLVNGTPVESRPLGDYTYSDVNEQTEEWSRRTDAADEERLDGHAFTTLHASHFDRNDFPQGSGLCVTSGMRSRRRDDPGIRRSPSGSGCVIQPGHVFVMGDNRDNSDDSRFWGAVPLGNIKGEALVVWWSAGGLDGIRWNRLGHVIQ